MGNPVVNPNSANTGNEPQIKNMGFIQRVLGVVFSPAETMKNLIAKPRLLFPFIIVSAANLLFIIANFDLFKENTVFALEKLMSRMNIDVTWDQLQKQAQLSMIMAMVSAPFVSLATWLTGTAILFGVIRAFKGEGSFKQFMSITGYAYVIMVLSLILTSVVSYFTGSYNEQLNITGLANLLPEHMSGTFLYGVLNGIELFTIWQYIVIGIGVSLVSKLSRKKVYSIIGVLYAVMLAYHGFAQVMAGQIGY